MLPCARLKGRIIIITPINPNMTATVLLLPTVAKFLADCKPQDPHHNTPANFGHFHSSSSGANFADYSNFELRHPPSLLAGRPIHHLSNGGLRTYKKRQLVAERSRHKRLLVLVRGSNLRITT